MARKQPAQHRLSEKDRIQAERKRYHDAIAEWMRQGSPYGQGPRPVVQLDPELYPNTIDRVMRESELSEFPDPDDFDVVSEREVCALMRRLLERPEPA